MGANRRSPASVPDSRRLSGLDNAFQRAFEHSLGNKQGWRSDAISIGQYDSKKTPSIEANCTAVEPALATTGTKEQPLGDFFRGSPNQLGSKLPSTDTVKVGLPISARIPIGPTKRERGDDATLVELTGNRPKIEWAMATHVSVSARSPRLDHNAHWVSHLLGTEPEERRNLAKLTGLTVKAPNRNQGSALR